jgi:hypothetical protein
MSDEQDKPQRRWPWFRFSLRTLMLAVLLVAVYLGGKYGIPSPFPVQLAGQWQAELPAGFKRTAKLTHLEGNRFVLSSAASVFNGVYEWKDNELTVVDPGDEKMMGLVWKWDGEKLILIDEPADTPTGPSYVGTTLERVPPSP